MTIDKTPQDHRAVAIVALLIANNLPLHARDAIPLSTFVKSAKAFLRAIRNERIHLFDNMAELMDDYYPTKKEEK